MLHYRVCGSWGIRLRDGGGTIYDLNPHRWWADALVGAIMVALAALVVVVALICAVLEVLPMWIYSRVRGLTARS